MHQFRVGERPSGCQLLSPRRVRITAAVVCLALATAISLTAAGVLTGSANALSPQVAKENIMSQKTNLAWSSDGFGGTWTNLGSVSLTPGVSYVVFATLGLQTGSADPGPIGAECALSLPNEPVDQEDADLNNVKGAQVANLSLEGVTALFQDGGNMSGSATLACHELGNPGTPTGWIFAHDARIIAIPVDGVLNNLTTTGCRGMVAPSGAC